MTDKRNNSSKKCMKKETANSLQMRPHGLKYLENYDGFCIFCDPFSKLLPVALLDLETCGDFPICAIRMVGELLL